MAAQELSATTATPPVVEAPLPLVSIAKTSRTPGTAFAFAEINGEPGLVLYYPDGSVGAVLALCVQDGLITESYIVVNPEKLSRVGHAAE